MCCVLGFYVVLHQSGISERSWGSHIIFNTVVAHSVPILTQKYINNLLNVTLFSLRSWKSRVILPVCLPVDHLAKLVIEDLFLPQVNLGQELAVVAS